MPSVTKICMVKTDSFMQHNDKHILPERPVDTRVFLERAQRYCATAEHCASDVQQLLARLGATDTQTDEVIGVLKEQNYLDEARYCRAFVHDKVAFQGWGRMKIIQGLRAKHLPDADIREALAAIDETAYAANIRKLVQSKRNQDKQRTVRFMLQRGYTFDDLRRYAKVDADMTDYETDD